MKRFALPLLAVLLLSGCSSVDTLSESEYYELVRDQNGLSSMQDKDIANIGGTVCAAFEEDADAYTPVLAEFLDAGLESGQAGALIALSLAQYCPDEVEHIPGQ